MPLSYNSRVQPIFRSATVIIRRSTEEAFAARYYVGGILSGCCLCIIFKHCYHNKSAGLIGHILVTCSTFILNQHFRQIVEISAHFPIAILWYFFIKHFFLSTTLNQVYIDYDVIHAIFTCNRKKIDRYPSAHGKKLPDF